jgi:purine nucleosidase
VTKLRKFIIDTDTGSDDAVALIMAFKSQDIEIEAITTVAGNITLDQATDNALMTMEITKGHMPPVYKGASVPLKRELKTAANVHGNDGMGDQGLIHPSLKASDGDAVDKIIEIVKAYPNEIEIVTIGPVTNIAKAILKDAQTMKKVKHIYAMATGGFGPGNITPVAEFNVYVDAEAFEIMLGLGVPVTIAGFDICLGEAALNKEEIEGIRQAGTPEGTYAMACNQRKIEWNLEKFNSYVINLPDPIAMAAALWPQIVLEAPQAHCYTCTHEEAAYGQVIVDTGHFGNETQAFNARVIKTIDVALYKEKLIKVLSE